jgi:hypothetical protein
MIWEVESGFPQKQAQRKSWNGMPVDHNSCRSSARSAAVRPKHPENRVVVARHRDASSPAEPGGNRNTHRQKQHCQKGALPCH